MSPASLPSVFNCDRCKAPIAPGDHCTVDSKLVETKPGLFRVRLVRRHKADCPKVANPPPALPTDLFDPQVLRSSTSRPLGAAFWLGWAALVAVAVAGVLLCS